MAKQESEQPEVYILTITKNKVCQPTDKSFTMDNLKLGNNYKPLDVYFTNAEGDIERLSGHYKDRQISNRTMPRLACQIFEDKLAGLSPEDRENFPVCQYGPDSELYRGIYTRKKDFREKCYDSEVCGDYELNKSEGRFFMYCISIFSTVIFVQECLNKFGKSGDRFILTYREKRVDDPETEETETAEEDGPDQQIEYRNEYSSMVIASKNLIFRGAPGTGKTYLARQIAADIVSNGECDDYDGLDDTQKEQIGFVQFHPSYDYTDFVEGLRPKANGDGTLGFELKDGVFKEFVARARTNCEQKYVFIIDEINRGEISKIFGELFFSVDPGYRGKRGEISTQYSNLHEDPDEKFYIPDNVYIIGTMNDVDRSVDSFDFAMRRRFRFLELKAADQTGMLDPLKEKKEEAVKRMNNLNKKIAETEGLNENYQIGPAYFLKLKDMKPDDLWKDHLKPLLQEYVRGMPDEKKLMDSFKNAYDCTEANHGDADGTAQD